MGLKQKYRGPTGPIIALKQWVGGLEARYMLWKVTGGASLGIPV